MTSEERQLRRIREATDMVAAIDGRLAEIRAAKARKSGKRAGSRIAKEAKREERIDRMAAIHFAVMERAAGRCEFCGEDSGNLDTHHILSGPLRRAAERSDTVAAICRGCHAFYHAGRADVLRDAYTWAVRRGFKDAARAIERRLEKIEEARRAPSIPIRVIAGRP
jgi:transcriptional regulator GlxA family with amidase domain